MLFVILRGSGGEGEFRGKERWEKFYLRRIILRVG
nr:MAG TPA: hypothetical protein [Caudoviricetes sp.]